jgi:hypothetical protein
VCSHVGNQQRCGVVIARFRLFCSEPSSSASRSPSIDLHLLLERSGTNLSSLAAWKLITKPKLNGGLGVIRLRLQNDALLMKNVHELFTKADLPWVHLIWSTYYSDGKVPRQTMKGSF